VARVLFLTESFHPVLGGGELHIRALGRSLVSSGMPATVVTRRIDPTWPELEEVDGIRIIRVDPPGFGRGGKWRMAPPAFRAVRRTRRDFDVLVVRGTRVLGLPGLAAARSVGCPVVMQPETNGELSGEAYTWGKRWGALRRGVVHAATAVRNRVMTRADAFVAMSRAIEEEMAAAGVAREKIRRIPHGVDRARFRPASEHEQVSLRRRLGLPHPATLLVYTGRLLRGKGLELLLDVFAGLAPVYPDAHLVLVGSGSGQVLSVEDSLRKKAADGPLPGRVTFTGRVDAVEDYLRASDIFVFPSVFEALGISLIEAAACGLPCVGSRTGGIVDVIEHERTGLLYASGKADALAAALRRVLDDRKLAGEWGRAATEKAAREFDAAGSLARYRELFSGLAGGSRS
jgi:glycosyltransferase involved in cell wall biosynthesis